jgi:hypothetical protein
VLLERGEGTWGRCYIETGNGGVVCSNDAAMSPRNFLTFFASCGIRPMIVALAG